MYRVGYQHARLGLKPADHSEKCRARIVRHMTADDDLNQRVQIAQDRIVGTAPLEARTGERDSVPEPARKKVRFAERVEEQIPEGTLSLQIHAAAVRAAVPVPIPEAPTAIATSTQVGESNQDSSKDRKLPMVLIWNWKGWSRSRSGIVFNDTLTVLF